MERLCELRALLKGWETVFERENGRRPGKADVAAASEDTKRLYREYRELKQQKDPPEQSPVAQQDSGCWGSHLNRQPKVPGTRHQPPPSASAQLYGMRLKANLGTALQETPSAVRRSLACRRKATARRGDGAASPTAASDGDELAAVLPTAVRCLAPLILTAGSKPRPQTDRFRKLKETVAQRLGSLDPGWLRRCQGTTGCGVGADGCEEGMVGDSGRGMGLGMGTLGQEEGMLGPEIGTPRHEEWARLGVRTLGCEEGSPGQEEGTLGPEMGTPGQEEGTRLGVRTPGQEEGTPGPKMGTPGHKEWTRPGVRTPGQEEGTPGPKLKTPGQEEGTLGPEMGTPGHEEWTRPGVRTPGHEEGTLGPKMRTPGHEEWTRPGLRTPGHEEGTPGPEIGMLTHEGGTRPGVRTQRHEEGTLRAKMGTPGPEMGTLGCEEGTLGQEEGTRAEVRAQRLKRGTLEPKLGTSEHEEGTLGSEMGTLKCEEGVPRPEEGTPEHRVGTLRPRRGTVRHKEVTLGCEEGLLEPAAGLPGPAVRTVGCKRVTPRRKRGTSGHEEGTPGPEMGTVGCEKGTVGHEEGTPGHEMGTVGCEKGTAGHEEGTPGPEMGTPGPEMGTARPKVASRGRKRGTPQCKRGTSGGEEGTVGLEEEMPGDDRGTPGPKGDTGRRRGRVPKGGTGGTARDGAVNVAKPRAARRKRPCPEDGKEEPTAAPKQRRTAPSPSENLLGDFEEEEEKPRAICKALPARAPWRPHGNFVRLNLKSRSHVRGAALRGRQLRKQVWKEKWQKKAAWFGGGGAVDRSSDVCFKCGTVGHWAAACRGRGTTARAPPPAEPILPNDEEEEEEDPLPTLEEVAHRTNTIYQELPASSNEQDGAELTGSIPYLDVQRPPYEPPEPPAPVEPLYSLGPDGKPQETPEEVLDALSELGYSSFRPGQEVAIMRILSGLSTLVVLPTGMGKSLCYQLPAFLYHKHIRSIALVVSPLVSLMDDQVSGLPPCLRAVCVHSHLSRAQRDAALQRVQEGSAQVLLLSPEALVGAGSCCLPPAHQLPPVAFACIDEAHCISEWSHNFRPSYLRLCKVLRDRLGIRCFLALTATATVATARDVAAHLGIPQQDGIAVQCAAVPPNLQLSVSVEWDRDRALVNLLRSERFVALRSIIVYCTRREDTTRVAALLRTCLQDELLTSTTPGSKSSHRLQPDQIAAAYHAGLTAAERRRVQSAFMRGRLRVVVATVAFGMGLDKADVRAVLHYNMPRNFESYVQEIGRAGRDGEPAWCHLFLDPEGSDRYELRRHIFADSVDFFTIKKLVQAVFPPCKCRELHRRRRALTAGMEVSDKEMAAIGMDGDGVTSEGGDDVMRSEGNSDGVTSDEDDDIMASEGGGERQRVCYKHERAIPIESTVQDLDLREEAIETLLCYLELHPRRWVELLPHTYSVCTVHCYGGPRQLRAAARSCPPLAVALARSHLSGGPPRDSSALQFDVVSLSDSMGWELPLVKRALRQLQWEPRSGTAARSSVTVQFSELCFHLRSFGDLRHCEMDAVCRFLQRRVEERQQGALRQLNACRRAFRSVAFQGGDPQPREEEEEERSGRLKALLREYFQRDPHGPKGGEEEEEEEEEEDEGLSAAEALQLRSALRRFLSARPDDAFTPRAIARIFHGIAPVTPLTSTAATAASGGSISTCPSNASPAWLPRRSWPCADVPVATIVPTGLEMSPVVLKMSPGASIVPTGLEMSPGCPQDVLKATGDVSVGPKMSSRTSGRPQGHQGCPHGPRDVPCGPQGVPMGLKVSPWGLEMSPVGLRMSPWASRCPHGPRGVPTAFKMSPRCPQGRQDVSMHPKMSSWTSGRPQVHQGCLHGLQDVPCGPQGVLITSRTSPWSSGGPYRSSRCPHGPRDVPRVSPRCPQGHQDVSVGPKMSSWTSGRPQGHQGCPHGPQDVPMGLKVSHGASRCHLWSSRCPHGPRGVPMVFKMSPRCPQGRQDVSMHPKMSSRTSGHPQGHQGCPHGP
ncbi:ATP-dependent DNA helicase Q4 isoform X4 [Gallus gallus]|uniref:ATP-dependent DNA helicase Q4 isoform X4 n=1 Tax=Gallus gallus TaxID=9031 RepID=UPI001AEA12F4|nr:ATP-dependent DNA helicase Q4 isoform X4 [Gallus gallus]